MPGCPQVQFFGLVSRGGFLVFGMQPRVRPWEIPSFKVLA